MEVLISTQLFAWLGMAGFVAYTAILAAKDTITYYLNEVRNDAQNAGREIETTQPAPRDPQPDPQHSSDPRRTATTS